MLKIDYMGIEAQKRARVSYNRFYDPSSGEKRQIAKIILDQALVQGIKDPLGGKLGCVSIFYKKYPKYFSKKKRDSLIYWDTKPDSDNLEKFLFDVLEKQCNLIVNDSKICAKMCFKLWGPYDRTIFFIDQWSNRSHFIQHGNCVGFNQCYFDLRDRSFQEHSIF